MVILQPSGTLQLLVFLIFLGKRCDEKIREHNQGSRKYVCSSKSGDKSYILNQMNSQEKGGLQGSIYDIGADKWNKRVDNVLSVSYTGSDECLSQQGEW